MDKNLVGYSGVALDVYGLDVHLSSIQQQDRMEFLEVKYQTVVWEFPNFS